MGNARTDPNGLPLHNPKSANGHGPDYCDECSYAAHDYVLWPCIGSMADDATPPVSAAPVVPRYTDDDPNEEPFVYEDDDAGSPVVPAATDEPAPERRCGITKPHPAHGTMWGRRLYRCPGITAPAATDVIREAVHRWWLDDPNDPCDGNCEDDTVAIGASNAVVAALEANGYALVPRKELDVLTAALHKWSCGSEGHSLDCQRAVLSLRL